MKCPDASDRWTSLSLRRLLSVMVDLLILPERWRSGVAYNPLAPRTVQDPYPAYAELRSRSPVHRSAFFRGWVFTRYADVSAILDDHRRFSSDPRNGSIPVLRRLLLPPPEEYTMLTLDPPDHTRLRALANEALTPTVAALEPRIRENLATLLDEVADPSAFDLMESVARPLSLAIFAEMLGVPPEDRARLGTWSARGARLVEPMISIREWRVGQAAVQACDAYFRRIIRERRASPRNDLVSALLRGRDEEARLNEREILNTLRAVLLAGNEVTANQIGNGFLALLRHPEQLERLRADPELIPGGVEELLRFDAPVQTNIRYALAECEVNGQALRQRENLVLLLGAANRDPEAFEDPARLDVGRRARGHLSFGGGIHHCVGAPLARLIGRIALEMLLERFQSMKLAGHRPRFRPSGVIRGLDSLQVRFVPA